MEDSPADILGENIWNPFTWRSGLSSKGELMRKYFDERSFPECQKQVLEFLDSYFVAFLDEDAVNRDNGLTTKFKNGSVVQILTDEFFFGFLDDNEFTGIQELKLLEMLCGYFQSEKLDPVKFLVFDCLFGNIIDEEVKDVSKDVKINFLGKLLSIAVGIKCRLPLEYCALMLQNGDWNTTICYTILTTLIKDFCFMVSSASQILEGIINLSPNFACELTELAPKLYLFNETTDINKDNEENGTPKGLPPISLIRIIGSWLNSQPGYFMNKKGNPFASIPSFYTNHDEAEKTKSDKCSIVGLLHWSVLSPLFAGAKISTSAQGKTSFCFDGNSILDAVEMRNASSQLHYGIISFLAMHRKTESSFSGDEDDLEPGEVAKQTKQHNLISENDIKDVITSLDETVEKLKDQITEEKLGSCIDRLAQIIQIGKWSGCLPPTSKKFKHVLKKLPKTKLFSKVLKTL